MTVLRRWVVLVALASLVAGCINVAAQVADRHAAARASPNPSGCVPGKPFVMKGSKAIGKVEIESKCPSSRSLEVGASRKVDLGSVTAKQPCRELPDFAGSWWRVVKPYPRHLDHLSHHYLPGKMTLVSQERSMFTAKAIELHMGKREIRFPAKGRLKLDFARIEGPVPQGGCA